MKLIKVKIFKAETCAGLLDEVTVAFRGNKPDISIFNPLCLIGPNGTGKSQLLQVIAEIFQAIFHQYIRTEERLTANSGLEFEIEYAINSLDSDSGQHIRIFRKSVGKKKPTICFEIKNGEEWVLLESDDERIQSLLPSKVIGYTSGDNETLSLPFLLSRSGYSHEVTHNATTEGKKDLNVPDTRLMLIDYGTNLEVLVANLLLNTEEIRLGLLKDPNLKKIRSFRCVVQLKPSGPPTGGVKLTSELERYIDNLKCCATTYNYDEKKRTYTFDYFVDEATHEAFNEFWSDALNLYSSFHKLAMLNDLVIPKSARQTFANNIKNRRFATRLPEPYEDNKVFRFERVEFVSAKTNQIVDYVSLSDGEHQLAQLLGTVCMASFRNVLFLLDEPESHFNPQWRVEFISKIVNLNTCDGKRSDISDAAMQECLISTHSPFVPSDMHRENVLIFSKDIETSEIKVRRPQIETYGSTFDAILEECFGVSPPMSNLPRVEIDELMKSEDPEQIRKGMANLGDSVERMFLADRAREFSKDNK